MRKHFPVQIVKFACLVSLLFISFSYAQKSEIGDFDIKKVREAVQTGMSDSMVREGITSEEARDSQKPLGENYLFVTLRLIGYLALIILIIVLTMWFIKRLGLTGTSRIGGGSMDILEALPIGQNRSLLLVRVMDAVYILAQSAQNVTLLEKIEGDKAVELIATTKGGTSIVQFKDVFNNFLGKIKKTP